MKQGFYRESFWDYIKADGINRSFLHRMINKSPGAAKWEQEHPETTDAMRVGDAFHAAVLEPKRFRNEYIVLPDNCRPGSGKGMKERKEAFETNAAKGGLTIITPNDMEMITSMQSSVSRNKEAMTLLDSDLKEVSGYFLDPDFDNILVKFRADCIHKDTMIVPDLKSCADARKALFTKSAYEHGYDMQAYLTLKGISIITGCQHTDFRFICVEKKGFCGNTVYPTTEEFLEIGRRKYVKAINLYMDCVTKDKWPGYPEISEPLGPPAWAKENLEYIYD